MDNDNCPKIPKCPLFQGKMLSSSRARAIYIKLFCNNGESGRMDCKRFLLTLQGIKPSIDIMPNDSRTVKEIINYINM